MQRALLFGWYKTKIEQRRKEAQPSEKSVGCASFCVLIEKLRNFSKHPAKWHPLFRVSRGILWKVEGISQFTLPKSQKNSQLVSERVYKMPFSLATYWGNCLPVYLHAVKIGMTLKIPKISVINYVMEKEVKKVGWDQAPDARPKGTL